MDIESPTATYTPDTSTDHDDRIAVPPARFQIGRLPDRSDSRSAGCQIDWQPNPAPPMLGATLPPTARYTASLQVDLGDDPSCREQRTWYSLGRLPQW